MTSLNVSVEDVELNRFHKLLTLRSGEVLSLMAMSSALLVSHFPTLSDPWHCPVSGKA